MMGYIKYLFLIGLLFTNNLFAAPEYAASGVEMKAVQVSEHVWYVKGASGAATENEGFISNSGFVITEEGVVVYDALGSPSLAQQLIAEIRKVTNKPIVKLILGHYHADHIYGAQVFKELGAEIIAPVGVYKYIDSDVGINRLEERRISLYPWVDDDTYIVKPDRLLDKAETFTLGGITLSLIHI